MPRRCRSPATLLRSAPAPRAPPDPASSSSAADNRNRRAPRGPCTWRQTRRPPDHLRRRNGDRRPMTARRSSGSSRADKRSRADQESQNITVSWRRSAPSVRGADAQIAGAGAATSPISLPQPPQNLAIGSFAKPQAGQGMGNGVPHCAQKRRVATFSAVQLRATHLGALARYRSA